jgi:hypothetical protein
MNEFRELSQSQIQHLTKRMPAFELSYETIAHKKVYPSYDVCLSIPTGKKYLCWFSFYDTKDVCYLMELNREKRVAQVRVVPRISFDPKLSLGTLLYGTLVSENVQPNVYASSSSSSVATPPSMRTETKERFFFVMEDIYQYCGISMKNLVFGEKLGYLEQMLRTQLSGGVGGGGNKEENMRIVLPVLWGFREENANETDLIHQYEKTRSSIPYPVHHIQIRKLREISPYMNLVVNQILNKNNQRSYSGVSTPTTADAAKRLPSSVAATAPPLMEVARYTMDFSKPQYRMKTVFQVSADIQFDVYHLYACGRNKAMVYYNIAYIPNIQNSIFMNQLFRNIRENRNIDYIEESDDDEDFQDMREDKYVNLNKTLLIECSFHTKFKKWVPLRVVGPHTKIVHIGQLVRDYYY